MATKILDEKKWWISAESSGNSVISTSIKRHCKTYYLLLLQKQESGVCDFHWFNLNGFPDLKCLRRKKHWITPCSHTQRKTQPTNPWTSVRFCKKQMTLHVGEILWASDCRNLMTLDTCFMKHFKYLKCLNTVT